MFRCATTNWSLTRAGVEDVVIVPKLGDLVATEIMDAALHIAQIDNATYFNLLARTSAEPA